MNDKYKDTLLNIYNYLLFIITIKYVDTREYSRYIIIMQLNVCKNETIKMLY